MIGNDHDQKFVLLRSFQSPCVALGQMLAALSGLSLICGLSAVSLSNSANADLLAYEGFDYETGSRLQGRNGGTGFVSEWDSIPYAGAPSLIADYHDISTGSLNFRGLETAGNHVNSNVQIGCCKGIFRELPNPILQNDTATMYVSFLLQPETLDNWFGLDLGPGVLGKDVFIGFPQPWTIPTPVYQIDNMGGERTHRSDVPAVVGETAFFVVKAEFTDGTDSFTLYVNPSPGLPEPRAGIVKADNEVGDVNYLGIASIGAFSFDEIRVGETFEDVTPVELAVGEHLQAGDADQDFDFDQLDLVQVLAAAKYLTGETATWGEGDWDGAPGGSSGNPPPGNGLFNQIDIIAALGTDLYMTGPYPAVQPNDRPADHQTSVVYDASKGEVAVDAPSGVELTSINIGSTSGIFPGQPAVNLDGSFDNDSDSNVFKASFGGSFGSLSFGNVAKPGLAEEFLLGDLTVIGSLQDGGGLGDVDLVYVPVPEPSTLMLALLGLFGVVAASRRR